MPKEQNKNSNKNWVLLTNIPFQMAIIIIIGVCLGKWMDEIFFDSQKQWFVVSIGLLSVFFALYKVIKQVNRLNK